MPGNNLNRSQTEQRSCTGDCSSATAASRSPEGGTKRNRRPWCEAPGIRDCLAMLGDLLRGVTKSKKPYEISTRLPRYARRSLAGGN